MFWGAVFVSNIVARRTASTPVLWFLGSGALMVNLGIVPTEGDVFISGLAELGIILIMFALGFEESTDNFLRSAKRSWGIAFFGAVAPFGAAYALSDYFWHDTNISIMCGLTMTATAVSLTMVALQAEGLHTSQAATRVMTSALLDDIASLALVAILVPIANQTGAVDAVATALIAGKAVMFFVIVSVLGAWFLPHETKGWLAKVPFVSTYGMRHLLEFGRHSTLTVLLLALLVGLLAHEFGFHPAIGAYMAGLIIREEYFTLKQDAGSFPDTKRIINNVAFSWIGPVFFIELGTNLDLDWPTVLDTLPRLSAIIRSSKRLVGACISSRWSGKISRVSIF